MRRMNRKSGNGKARARRRPILPPRWWRAALAVLGAVSIIGSAAITLAWMWQSGQVGVAMDGFRRAAIHHSARAGLVVLDVLLEGRVHTDARAVLAAVGLRRGDAILDFDPDTIRARLMALAWVRDASVERRLPGTVRIKIVERKPIALWQRKGRLALVDDRGVVITTRTLNRFRNLIIVAGRNAPKHVAPLLTLIATEPTLARRVNGAVRVGNRRWNLKLAGGIGIWLPENDPLGAWRLLARLESRHRLLGRDVKIIDLRLPDRLIVRPASPHKGITLNRKGKRT